MVKLDEVEPTPPGLIAFLKFDFDGNESFNAYKNSVEISTPTPATLWRLKGRWYKKQVDPALDIDRAVAAATGSTAKKDDAPKPFAAKPSKVEEPEEEGPRQRPTARPASSSAPTPAQPSSSRPSAVRLSSNMEYGFLAIHLFSVVTCVFLLLPGSRAAKFSSFRWCCTWNFLAALLRFYARFGVPKPLTVSAIKDWALVALAAGTTETLHAMLLLSLVFQRYASLPASMFLISPSLMSCYHLLSKAKRVFGTHPLYKRFGERVHKVFFDRKAQAIMISSRCEVLALFLFILDPILGGRLNLMGAFFYFNFLKLRYNASDSSEDHKAAWHWVGRRAQPLLARFPVLQKVAEFGKNVFLAQRRAQ